MFRSMCAPQMFLSKRLFQLLLLSLLFASLFFFCQTLFSPHDHYFQIVVGGEIS